MRRKRHAAIVRIVEQQDVETQAELLHLLEQEGFEVTQATVSRDITQLGLIKTRGPEGRGRYAAPIHGAVGDVWERARRALQDYVIAMHGSGPFILIKTLSGRAHALAAALDEIGLPDVLGTLAGDDAVLLLVNSGQQAPPAPEVVELLSTLNEWRS